ncbi:MAG TPA: hypothetical protein VI588_02570, partial [Candidatus Gracilibacteria bacterium]|nr:hypothetical protein [Candidatus Gracilibacteria bacterium]
MSRKKHSRINDPEFKIMILKIVTLFLGGVIIVRLFYLQVIQNEYYQAKAAKEHFGYTELPARRGEIFIKDYASDEMVRVATNVTLDTLFADPKNIKNPKLIADRIVPMIFNQEEQRAKDDERVAEEHKRAQTQEDIDTIKPLTDEELYRQYYDDVLMKISQQVRPV